MSKDLSINDKIRLLRERSGLNQSQMAEKLCMTVTGYGKIERGEVSVNQERLESICKVFGISISEIYDKPIDETVKSEIAYLRSLLMAKEEVIEALKKQILLLEKIKS